MGRTKLPIRLINSEKSRSVTFAKRRKGLKKKMFEFSTLCDVDVCLIVYGPGPVPSLETWPEDPAEVRRVIDRFDKAPKEERAKRTHDVSSFLQSKNKKLQDELDQKRRENTELALMLLWSWSGLDRTTNPETISELWSRLTSLSNVANERIRAMKKKDCGEWPQHDQLDLVSQSNHVDEPFRFNDLHDYSIHENDTRSLGLGHYYSDPVLPSLPYSETHEGMASILRSHGNSSQLPPNELYNNMFHLCTSGGSGLGPHSSNPVPALTYGPQEGVSSYFTNEISWDMNHKNLPADFSRVPSKRSCVLPTFRVPPRKRTEPLP